MHPREQLPIEQPPALVSISGEVRGLFAAGWHAAANECRVVNLSDQTEQLVSLETWRGLRELAAAVPAQLQF